VPRPPAAQSPGLAATYETSTPRWPASTDCCQIRQLEGHDVACAVTTGILEQMASGRFATNADGDLLALTTRKSPALEASYSAILSPTLPVWTLELERALMQLLTGIQQHFAFCSSSAGHEADLVLLPGIRLVEGH